MAASSGLFGQKNRCDWGEKAWSEDDDRPCDRPAVGVVAVRNPVGILKLDLCSTHRDLVLSETAPAGS